MQLSLSDEQFKNLVLLVYLGEWVANSHLTDPHKELAELADHVFALAGRAGLSDAFEYAPDDDTWYPTADFEEAAEEYSTEYDDEVFWSQLADRMAFRDFYRTYGKDADARMSIVEKLEKSDPFIEKYEKEVDEHGIDRLEIRDTSLPLKK